MSNQLSVKQIVMFVSLSVFFTLGSLVMAIEESEENVSINNVESSTPKIENIIYPTKTATVPLSPIVMPSSTSTQTSMTVCDYPETWEAYIVIFGDTLVEIADRLFVDADSIVVGNCLAIPFLEEGDVIYLPPKTIITPTVVESTEMPKAEPTTQEVLCGAPTDWKTYQVKKGDTLFGISNGFGIEITQLQFANCMGDDTSIIIGTTINVPNITPTFSTPTS